MCVAPIGRQCLPLISTAEIRRRPRCSTFLRNMYSHCTCKPANWRACRQWRPNVSDCTGQLSTVAKYLPVGTCASRPWTCTRRCYCRNSYHKRQW
jgi:hypothetical protein